MQIIVDNKPVNFASSQFQTAYSKTSCTADLPTEPIHFHDGKDQIVHIHWDSITGGELLKNYGWNYIGGSDKTLGYRFDRLPKISSVPIHGKVLPEINNQSFYIYTGDENGYKVRSFNDFINEDLEKFFNHPSSFPSSKPETGLANFFAPKAYAHGDEKLDKLNNLIGNIVIFVGNKPSDQAIKERFTHLEPLSDSVCGG
jgi:hypothetical protein